MRPAVRIKGLGPAIIRVVILVVSACVLFVVVAYTTLNGHSGEAANVAGLGRVYKAAGPGYAGFFTNSFLHKLPFTEPISWERSGGRASVSLASRVDVVLFKSKMANEPFTTLYVQQGSFGPRAVFEICHRVGDAAVLTTGKLDLSSGEFTMTSNASETTVDDAEWRHMTNNPFVQFEFQEKR
jgi:hypothetical protein